MYSLSDEQTICSNPILNWMQGFVLPFKLHVFFNVYVWSLPEGHFSGNTFSVGNTHRRIRIVVYHHICRLLLQDGTKQNELDRLDKENVWLIGRVC